MATAILFTTIEAIRSSVGLDDADVPDELILNQNLRMLFTLDLDTWYPATYEDDWADSGFDPLDDSDTDILTITAEERKGFLLSAYSMWFGALRIVETMLAVPQKISDGKDELQRFSGTDLQKIYDRIANNKAAIKSLILQEASSTTTTILGVSRVVSETYDPVTGQ